ncbi:MAG: cell envelope biogenesis protein TolA [Pseudotabrizicola sp.]|uniref:cell envelope biogenesis protein TolA n=1 Tax=Pseudotabrizicola sp. TaxID=2939647 RepID=UPI00271BC590|nr:cell envelope biogenesis protein TolA [Pseudotabrizicola sp.]MDO9637522.1 cell envelope biogenesis protein TolA [Pseudotabrizicola sp.]
MQTGTLISGAGHAALILWVILGDWLFQRKDAPPVEVAEVSLISSAEFDAMVAAAPSTPTPAPQPAPEPPAETPAPAPVVEAPPPVVADLPATTPAPAPEPVPEPEPLPENNGVADALPLPVNPDPIPEVPLPPTASPRPKPAPRVAPVPVDAPEPAVEVAEAPVAAVTPDPVQEPEVVEPEEPEAQPEEAGTVLETEANRNDPVVASGAPPSSPRPRGRPVRSEAPPLETARPTQTPTPTPTPAPTPDTNADAVAAALAEAMAAEDPAPTGGATNAPQGPPMTSGERDAMRVAVQQCWNVGSLSSDALNTTVVVYVSVAQNGVPDAGSIRMVSATGGSDAGARGAFEAARRAIIRCGARGFPLPPEKYDQWREMELVFNPDGMRMR